VKEETDYNEGYFRDQKSALIDPKIYLLIADPKHIKIGLS